jgi:hypothetical protein
MLNGRKDQSMAIGKVTEHTGETIGMINARRWSYFSAGALAGAIWAIFDWKMAFFFSALACVIALEAKRVRLALWPECYNAMRWIMDEHGFELDGEPQIYKKSERS